MSKINKHPVRRTAAGVLAGALALSGAVAAATPASAAVGFGFDRLAGNDRYETSAATAARFRATAGPAITNVILASGESGRTPDALAATFLAGVQNAPVLITRRDTTPEPILAELRALRSAGATTITVVGGPVAVSSMQLDSFRALGFTTVTRLGGDNRYETAREIVEAGESAAASNVGLVASGVSTIDALAGGPLAYKGKHPLFLVTRDGIPGATLEAMRTAGVTSVYILGGEAVVGQRVVDQLAAAGVTVTDRLAGGDRSTTSVRIAEELIADHGFTSATFNLAPGVNEGVDALGGAALSGKENRPLLITNTATSAAPVVDFAMRNAAKLNAVGHIFGGVEVVSRDLEERIVAAAGGTQFGAVTLTSSTVAPGGTLTGTIAGEDIRSASVSGCGLTDQAIAPDDNATAGRQFTLTVPSTQSAGNCTLTFTVAQVGGGSVTRTVNVNVDAQAPTVTAQSAAPVVGATTVTFTADEDLAEGSVAAGDFTITGGTAGATVTGVTVSGGTITVTTGPLAEGNVVTLTAGSVTDVVGNAGPAAAVSTQATAAAPDTTAPSVTAQSTAPAAGATTVTFTANEDLAAGSVAAGDFTITGGTAGATVTGVTVSGGTITVTTGPLAEGNVVTLTAGSVTDVIGNAGPAADVSTPATTAAADTTAPTFASAAAVGGTNTLTLTYSETLACTTVDVDGSDYTATYGTFTGLTPTGATCSGTTVTLTFGGSPFETGVSGTVDKVDTAVVTDVAGNDQPDTDTVSYTVS